MRHRRSPRPVSFPRCSPPLWPAIVLLIVSSGVDAAWGQLEGDIVKDEKDSAGESPALRWRMHLEQGLRDMSVGSLQDRLVAVSEADALLKPDDIAALDDPASPTQDEIGAALIAFFESEQDEWIRWNLLDSTWSDSGPAVHALFRGALVSPSSNLRAKALSFYAYDLDPSAVPLLEGLWETGVPSWALPDLMAALAAQGSTLHLREFLDKTRAPEVRTRIAAIRALADLRDDRALPRLIELARSGESFTRRSAIDALERWPESDEVAEALAEATLSDPEWRGDALDALLKSDSPVRNETLLRLLSNPEDRVLWVQTAGGLMFSNNSEVTPALVGALAAAVGQNDPGTVRGLINVLYNRDDRDAVPLLSRLDPDINGSGVLTVRILVAYLERDRASRPPLFIATPGPSPPAHEPEADPRHIIAGRSATSVRCWHGPEIAFDSWLRHRIQDGTEVTIERYFDVAGETWAQLSGSGAADCWVPLRQIADGAGPGVVPPDPRRPEVDLPAGSLRTSTALALLKDGTLEVVDESEEAVGIAVNIRVPGPSLQDILETLRTATRRTLDEQMGDVLAWLDDERDAGMH